MDAYAGWAGWSNSFLLGADTGYGGIFVFILISLMAFFIIRGRE